jgi:hypothetical protein
MGSRGPVPKREDQRRRTNQDEGPVTKSRAAPARKRVPAADKDWHPLAKKWYQALARSGQAAFFEPSDWAEAQVWAEVLSQQLYSEKLSAMMLAAWGAASARLLVTEGDRRRVRIELERARPEDPDEAAAVASMAAYRDRGAR